MLSFAILLVIVWVLLQLQCCLLKNVNFNDDFIRDNIGVVNHCFAARVNQLKRLNVIFQDLIQTTPARSGAKKIPTVEVPSHSDEDSAGTEVDEEQDHDHENDVEEEEGFESESPDVDDTTPPSSPTGAGVNDNSDDDSDNIFEDDD